MKRAVDIFVGLIGTIAYFCLLPIVALLIKLDSTGPILYKQQRVGLNRRRSDRRQNTKGNILVIQNRRNKKNDRRTSNVCGSLFTIYKFRTMGSDAEKNGPQLCAKGVRDPRITRVGKWLRYFHIDELPQFIHILKGEMSLIGPRPERPFFTEKYIREIPHYVERMRYIKPGLTGLAQITLGYDESLQTVNQKYRYDLTYRIAMTSFSSWFRVETWTFINTFRYLGSNLIHSLAFHRRTKNSKPKESVTQTPTMHIAHPWKLIEKISARQNSEDQVINAFFEEFHAEAMVLNKS